MSLLRRAWGAPLIVHAAVFVAVMAGVSAFIGTGASLVDDEGAGILQAQAIEHGHWTVANPLPRVDPTGASYPIHQPLGGTKGNAPVGKNLVYFMVLAALGKLFGSAGMVGLSIAGTVAAALLAARLARELGASERAAFWLVGLASPLFFDGFLVVAHTVAAALVVASALLGLWFLRDGRRATFVSAIVCAALATLLRTEAALWALGFAVGALAATMAPGARLGNRRRGLILTLGSVAAAFVAREANSVITHLAIGSAVSAPAGSVAGTGASGTPGDQVAGLLRSWFEFTGSSAAFIVVEALVLALLAVWARGTRDGRSGNRSTMAMAGAVAAVSLYVAVFRPNQYVAGIAIVFPVLWTGLWLLGRPTLRDPTRRLLVVSSVAYALLVTATEYSDAGAWEPGRYFFLAIPVMVPVIVLAFGEPLRRLASTARVVAVALAVVAIAATTFSAVGDLNTSHERNGAMAAAVSAIASLAQPGDKGPPVVVTTQAFLPRLEWATFPLVRWQLVRQDRLPSYGAALARAGIQQFVLVTTEPSTELNALRPRYRPVRTEDLSAAPQWRLIVLDRS